MANAAWRECGRPEAVLLVGAVVSFCVSYAVALAAVGPAWSWGASMLSDLGSATCLERGGRLVCSPMTVVFNSGVVVAGISVLLACVRSTEHWGFALTSGLLALGAGLVVVGVCPSDLDHGVHMAGATLALPVASLGVLVSGLGPAGRRRPGGTARAWLGAIALTACLDHLAGASAPVPRGPAELVSVLALLTVLLLEARRCWGGQHPEGQAAGCP